jgi:3-hydroxybutyryl-CoA dehydrogenase
VAIPEAVTRVGVIGNGIIGHGVAQIFAAGGVAVTMVGRSRESLERALVKIERSLEQFRDHGLTTAEQARATLARVVATTSIEDVAGADFVVEAVPFDAELQRTVFEQLDRLCPPPAVLATSSGAPASSVTGAVVHRERVVATHFWNPPQLIPLVEVCPAPETDPEVGPWVCELLRAAGKEPVPLEREVPGFIGNRLQFALWREAVALWGEGVASADAIDRAVKASFGRRLPVTGPLESFDLAGQRTIAAFAEFLLPSLDTTPRPHERYRELVEHGGEIPQMCDWSSRDPQALAAQRVEELFVRLRQDRA